MTFLGRQKLRHITKYCAAHHEPQALESIHAVSSHQPKTYLSDVVPK